MRTKREIKMRWQDTHDLLIPAGTRVERAHGTGPYAVRPGSVTLLSKTGALFKHDATYRFIFVSPDDLEA